MAAKPPKIIPPRETPDRDSRYMGLAWIHAGFSKDPNTQVGAQIVDQYNQPLGSGYNGPPRKIDDSSFSWCRPPKDDPDAFCKYPDNSASPSLMVTTSQGNACPMRGFWQKFSVSAE